ncbi:MAG: Na/Pi cotransporter family protein [Desulfitobacteriaceae bacterium]|nr:Na/Pi cotransporter family protein [Desulfitobacteriaceae bacterium]
MTILFGLFGGLAIFIFGMHFMGEGLQKAAGDRMQKILEALTSVPVIGVLVGALVTAIIQSSSATTVMTVGFVNAGLMNLKQAISVIMGANIGTTMTAQLIAFKLSNFYLPIIALGFGFYFFAKRKNFKYIGQVVFSFGLLLMGLEIMGDSMRPLREYQGFRDVIASFGQYKILGVITGLVMTTLIQSSSATIGILMAMSTQGLIPLEVALPVLLGDNIGTCVTAVLASIGAKLSAKRAAVAHVFFNVTGTLIFVIFMPLFIKLILTISPPDDIARQIANAHTSFNLINTMIFLPLITIFSNFITKVVPGKEKIIKKGPVYLDQRVLSSPSIAISVANLEIIRMGELAADNLDNAMRAFVNRDTKLLQDVLEIEDVIDQLEEDITEYLAKISQHRGLTESSSSLHTGLLHAVNDIERVGDHAHNIAHLAEISIEENIPYSEYALNELKIMHKLVIDTFKAAVQGLRDNDITLAEKVLENEMKIDEMEKSLRRSHILRLNEGYCIPHSGVIFLDIISNLERVGDHSTNIASVVKQDI